MQAKPFIIALILIALAGGGAWALYQVAKPPSLSEIRANPVLFRLDDYKDKAALHTRLLALFPRGTRQKTIGKFFDLAGQKQSAQSKTECIITHSYSRARFHFSASEQRLTNIQVLDDSGAFWPDFKENCTKPRPSAPPQGKNEPLTPHSSSQEQPIYLPLEPIPGVE